MRLGIACRSLAQPSNPLTLRLQSVKLEDRADVLQQALYFGLQPLLRYSHRARSASFLESSEDLYKRRIGIRRIAVEALADEGQDIAFPRHKIELSGEAGFPHSCLPRDQDSLP